MLHFDAFAKKLLSPVHLKYFSAHIHIQVVVKYLEFSRMHEDVKFKFGVTARKIDIEKNVHENHYETARNKLK